MRLPLASFFLAYLSALSLHATPNIIFVLTDDLGYGDLGVLFQNGRNPGDPDKKISTPFLDSMAAEGMILDRHYCPAPVCAPSRASLLSGMHQGNATVRNNQFDRDMGENHTMATILKQAGYYTACIGKWGLQGSGSSPATWTGFPTKRGFDYFYGYHNHVGGHVHYPIDPWPIGNSASNRNDPGSEKRVYENNNEISADLGKCYTTDLFTARAKKLIIDETNNNPTRPFFLYLAYDTPHAALQVPTMAYPAGKGISGGLQWVGNPGNMINTAAGTIDSYYNPLYTGHGWPNKDQRFATMITRIDHAMGDLIQTLKDLNIDQNTIIVFSSDNGPHTESYISGVTYNPTAFKSYGPFEGTKRDLNEGGWRVPTLAWGPSNISANATTSLPSQFHDWIATFSDYANITPPANGDGVSLRPTLTGTGTQKPNFVYSEYFHNGSTKNYGDFPNHKTDRRGQQQAIYLDGYKGLRNNISSHADEFEIYDTTTDLKEANNLAGTSPFFNELQQRMKDSVLRWRKTHSNARPYDNELIPAVNIPSVQGLDVSTYEGTWPWIPEFEILTPLSTTQVTNLDPAHLSRPDNAGLYYEGLIDIPQDGTWTFYASSDEGTTFRIHESLVIDDDFAHNGSEANGSLRLEAGLHPFRLYYRTETDPASLSLQWKGPGVSKTNIPDTALRREIAPGPIPFALDDSVTILGTNATNISVLDNDLDDGLPSALSLVSVGNPTSGTAVINGTNITYTPDPGCYGLDTFSYTITDGTNTATAIVRVIVNVPHNDLWFPLNETSGATIYEAGGSALGSASGFADLSTAHLPGKHGYAMTFDGDDDQINLSGLSLPGGNSPRTVSAWIRTSAANFPENQVIFGYGNNSNGQRFSVRLNTGNKALRLEVQGGSIVGTTPLNDGNWHHIAVVIENGVTNVTGAKLYVDGLLENISNTSARTLNTTSLTTAAIGASTHAANYNFIGEIDELRILHSASSAAQVIALRDLRSQPSTAWHYRHFGNAPIDWTADTDGDGFSRLYEYAFGGNPKLIDRKLNSCIEHRTDSDTLEIVFNRLTTSSSDLTYTVEASSDLQTWDVLTTTEISSDSHPTLGTDFEEVRSRTDATVSSQPKQFLRVKVEF